MNKHTNLIIPCPSCEEKLKEANPKLANWFKSEVKPLWPDAHVSWSFRNHTQQNEAVAMGKSKLPWPKSKHNVVDHHGMPCAEALDLFQLCSNGMAAWVWKYFKEISEKFPHMRWGGNFKSLGDADHFEI